MVRNVLILCFIAIMPLMANIGKIVALKGDAVIVRDSKEFNVQVGTTILKSDEITTKDESKLQLLFNDNTVITIGKNSNFKVHDYLYDAKNQKYEVKFGLLKGTFRTITGKIGKIAPNKFKLQSKTSSIGIRGTQILSKMAVIGDRIVCIEGEIIVTHLKTGKTVIIKAGEFVDMNAGDTDFKVQKLTPQDIEGLDEDTRFLINKEIQLKDFDVQIAESNSIGWGVWNEDPEDIEEVFLSDVEQSIDLETDPNYIINATHTATYDGKVSGAHYTAGVKSGDYINNSNNTFSMTVNFGTNNISADLSAKYINGGVLMTDTINNITGTVKADGSGFDILGPNGVTGYSGIWGGTGSGTFSGSAAEYVSGDFNFDDGYGEESKGTFDATSN